MMARDRCAYRVQASSRFGATLGSARQPIVGARRRDPYRQLRFWRTVAAVLTYMILAETLVLVIR